RRSAINVHPSPRRTELMPAKIRYPYPAKSGAVPLVLRPKYGGQLFVASGTATGCHPLVGVLQGMDLKTVMALGHAVRQPKKRPAWSMAFDLVGWKFDEKQEFRLSVCEVGPGNPPALKEQDVVEKVTFKLTHGVEITGPEPLKGPHAKESYSPYGSFTAPDTTIVS